MFKGLGAIIYKETRHIVRDPRTLFLMLVIPGLELVLFGYAVNMDVKDIKTVVLDLDGRRESREFLEALVNTTYFKVIERVDSDERLNQAIVRNEASVGIKFPRDFTDNVLRRRPAQVQLLIDGSDSTVAMQALNAGNAVALSASFSAYISAFNVRTNQLIEARPRVLFNPDLRTTNFMIPGLVAVILQVVIMILTTFAIVHEKERGTLEQLMVTPVSRLGLFLGKLIPYAVVGIFEAGTVLFLMRFLFTVPIAGSVTLLFSGCLLFLMTALSLGLIISTFTDNQIQALQFAMLVILPSVLLSGFIFPQDNMPLPIYALGQVVPATYFIRILRGVVLRDAHFVDLWPNMAVLAAVGIGLLLIASMRFKKTVR